MPPRKRQRLSGSKAAEAVAAGSETTPVATSADDLPELQKMTARIVEAMYELRHSGGSTIHLSDVGPLKPENGLFPWPVQTGGTFKAIAQRAWTCTDDLLDASAQLAFKCGFTQSADSEEFTQQFCKVEVRFPCRCRVVQIHLGLCAFEVYHMNQYIQFRFTNGIVSSK